MTHNLYMDVHVPRAVTDGLRRRGIDVVTAQEDGTDEFDDEPLLRRATGLSRILFTQDEDLLAIARRYQATRLEFVGLVYAHQLGPGIGRIIEDLALLCLCAGVDELRNQIIYLPLR